MEEGGKEFYTRPSVRRHILPPGMLVDYETQQSATWLDQAVNYLKSWKTPRLVTWKGEDLSRLQAATVFLPRSKDQEVEKLLKLKGVQNPKLLIGTWKVTNTKEEGHGQILTIGIDPESCEGEGVYYPLQVWKNPRLRTQEAPRKGREERDYLHDYECTANQPRQPLGVHLMMLI